MGGGDSSRHQTRQSAAQQGWRRQNSGYGTARIEGDSNRHSELTSTGAIMGTVDYMAPEQALSTKDADARSDILQPRPFPLVPPDRAMCIRGDSLMAKLLAHREAEIPSLVEANDEVPEWLDDVFSPHGGQAA